MIPLPASACSDQDLHAALREAMRAAGDDASLAEDLVASVTAFCDRHAPPGWWPSACVDALIARALVAIGAGMSARRWLFERLGHETAENWWRVLDQSPAPAGDIMFWIAADLVRLERWQAARGRAWSIDVARTRARGMEALALASFPGLRRIIEQLAPAWDADGGMGVLVLRGAGEARRRADGEERAPDYARAVLARAAAARGWNAIPEIWTL
jgi:hypothetical protein